MMNGIKGAANLREGGGDDTVGRVNVGGADKGIYL